VPALGFNTNARAEKIVKIYALIDPRDGTAFYVGATSRRLSARLSGHMTEACHLQTRNARCEVIRAIAAAGARPEIDALEIVQPGDWVEAEQFWIANLRAMGVVLTNRAMGGPGSLGALQSPETKLRRQLAAKGRDMTALHTPSVRAAASKRMRHDIEIDGVRYSGIAEASRQTGIPKSTIYYRLDVGLAQRLTRRKGDKVRKRKGGIPKGLAHSRRRPVLIGAESYWGIVDAAQRLQVAPSTVHRWLISGRAQYISK
jgi:hypothetical protein